MSKIFFLSFTIIVALGFWLTIQWLNGRSSFDNVWTYYDFDKNDLASFCEKTLWNKPVRQPVNTFSNIAYLLTAIFVLRKEWVEKNTA